MKLAHLLLQEDASVVHTFVHVEYGGSWSVDADIDTATWWGLETQPHLVHPPASEGEILPLSLDRRSRELFDVRPPKYPRDLAHSWVEKEAALAHIDNDSGDTAWRSAREWIEAMQGDRFMVVFDNRDVYDWHDEKFYLANPAHAAKYQAAVARHAAKPLTARAFRGGLSIECAHLLLN
eukprot:COSAG01_NODE_5768_length_4046_cov_1.760578_6_plen_179_part_00